MRTTLGAGRSVDSAAATEADEALQLAQRDPARSQALARSALTLALECGDFRAASVAEVALGLVAREGHDLVGSVGHIGKAVKLAEAGGLPQAAAQARVRLAGSLALQGSWAPALRELDRASQFLTGVDLARAHAQQGAVLMARGCHDQAIEALGRALPRLRRYGDRLWEARARANRGLAHYHRGELAAAEADLRRAEGLCRELGEHRMAASAGQHLGMVVGRRGDVPAALTWFDTADRYFQERGAADGLGAIDRSEVLLAARLFGEARAAADMAVSSLRNQGQHAYLGVAQLKLAEVALAQGELHTVHSAAAEARKTFQQQDRPGLAALARHLSVAASWAGGERSPSLLRRAVLAADALSATQFTLAALDARLLAAQLAIQLGRRTTARRQLGSAALARRRGPVQLRARAWHAEALLRLADGNKRGAESALRAGMAVLDSYRAVLGATELRAHASGQGADLARLGLALALEGGDASRVLAWAERWRAGALLLRPVRPPEDGRLAASLAELRALVSQVEAAAREGRPVARLVARQAALEGEVRGRARQARGALGASLGATPGFGELAEAVGDRALVELFEVGDRFHAVVVVDGRATLHRLGPCTEVRGEVERVRFSLRRLALARGSPEAQSAAADAVSHGARRLDELLLAPVAAVTGSRELVLIPTGELHALPWAGLPSCSGRPLTVAPSAAVWHRATVARRRPSREVVLVAGPDLAHAGLEVSALARRYPGARRLTGEAATCQALCSAMDGAGLVHVAAHGRFRADNPLFSSLLLADGPLTVYDLEALKRPPQLLVLSACDSGLSDVRPGDELMGLTSSLLALGTATLVASVYPVPDAATRKLMLGFHAGLRSGLSPAAALARAQVRSMRAGGRDLAAAAAFVCYGWGG